LHQLHRLPTTEGEEGDLNQFSETKCAGSHSTKWLISN